MEGTISRNDAYNTLTEYYHHTTEIQHKALREALERVPDAEVQAEIVRCKDCKYNSNTCGNYVNCDIIPQMFGRTTDNSCSLAERRTDE